MPSRRRCADVSSSTPDAPRAPASSCADHRRTRELFPTPLRPRRLRRAPDTRERGCAFGPRVL